MTSQEKSGKKSHTSQQTKQTDPQPKTIEEAKIQHLKVQEVQNLHYSLMKTGNMSSTVDYFPI